MFSALEVYENALYKFTFDIDIDILSFPRSYGIAPQFPVRHSDVYRPVYCLFIAGTRVTTRKGWRNPACDRVWTVSATGDGQ